ncbi:hypothetical protein G6O67_005193 [Ophiocordyceps sinensis]|uniref:Transcription factor Cys6 n=1 Tax=Ophiocordyceps sinensis TaxID=72228 RepID=A0A8H4V5M9_9HYPO|nr:hypothetical protein G6O67_005193 [Ophiocordyceps sinensis]
MAAPSPRSSLPQGFSVYQPALGAQLQFFPARGTQQLDELINAHVPGPASIKDKRASISLDFLEYARATGQTFKFYAAAASVAASPLTGSPPSLDSATSSSLNVSPVPSSWDWSATASTADFSSLPGMKILTKDGLDVTNSASRGSKTKEQRDHAHLMRIIKACDACRRKKIRCDPSHKKRGGPLAHTQSVAATGSKPSRKTKSPPQVQSIPRQSQPPPPPPPLQPGAHASETLEMDMDDLEAFLTPSLDLDFSFSHLESMDPLAADFTWDDFMQFSAMDAAADYDFHLYPENDFAGQSSGSSSSISPFKVSTPQSQQEPGAPPAPDTAPLQGVQAASPKYPFLDQPGSAGNYTDFNLFSPESSFSEDDRMLSVGSSSSEPMSSQYSLALPNTASDYVAGIDHSNDSSLADSTHPYVLSHGVSSTSDTIALTTGGYDGHVLDHVPTSLHVSGSATAAALHREPQATLSTQDCVAATASSASERHLLSVTAVHQDALLAHLAASDDAHARAPRDGAVDSNDLESLDADPSIQLAR